MIFTANSPLRYPGGKAKIAYRLLGYFPPNLQSMVSPFFGGGSVELLIGQRGTQIHGYDHDSHLVGFWQHLLRDPVAVAAEAARYLGSPPSAFKDIKRQLNAAPDNFARAGQFYVVNRMSFSGMTKHGGASPTSDRFTARGVTELKEFRNPHIEVQQADFRESLDRHACTFAFLDPPYFEADKLYDGHSEFDHSALLACLKDRQSWVMTYDDCEAVRTMYDGFPMRSHDVRYGLSDRVGKEVIIGSRNMAPAMGASVPSRIYFNDNKPSGPVIRHDQTACQHWHHVGTRGRIAEKMSLARMSIDDVVNGSQRLAIVIGAPGIGKSELARDAMSKWKHRGLDPVFGQPSNKQHLIELLAESRGSRPLVLEEADILFRSGPMTELLKLVVDPKAPAYIAGRRGSRIPIGAPMVLLGNFQLNDLARNHQNQAKALFDRHAPVEIHGQPQDLYDWTVYLALSSDLLAESSFQNRSYRSSGQDRENGIEWFRNNLWNLKSVSPRTLQKVTGWYMRHRLKMDMTNRDLELRLSSLVLEFPQFRDAPKRFDWVSLGRELRNSHRAGLKMVA